MANYLVIAEVKTNIVHGYTAPPRIKCEQYDGDYTRLIHATLYNGDQKYTIPSEVRRITVSGIKPDGTGFSYDCTWSGAVVSLSLMRQMTVVYGEVPCNITLLNAAGNQLSTAVIVLDVERAALQDTVLESSNDFQTIIDYLQAAELYSQYSKSYAVGHAGVRSGENVDNSEYYAHLARMYKGSPLIAATAAEMTDKTRVYVYVGNETGYANGNWYYWNDSEWVAGGVYNAQGVQTDKRLITPDVAADAEAVGNKLYYTTPEEYGAIGDGLTDDTNALQSALNNGNVHLKGAYLVTNNITIPSTTQLIGCGDGTKIILRNASILLANVDNVQFSDFLIEFSHENTVPALKITDCRFSTFENISIVSDMNFTNNTTTGIDIHCEDGQRFSLNSLSNITIKNCNIGISMYATGSGYITSNVFASVRISEFVKNAIIFEGGKVYTNLFIGATIQDSFASNYDRYGITQISGYKNDFIDVAIWADARGRAHQFTALKIDSVSSYPYANAITGYIEGMIDLSGEYNRLYADFGWVYVDSVSNTSRNMGRIDNTNRNYLCVTEWDNTAKRVHEAGTYFILAGTMRKAIANIAVGDALVEGTNYASTLMSGQLSQKDVLYNISPDVSKVTINDSYCCYNGRLVVAMFSLTTNDNLARNDDIIKKLPRPCIGQTPVTIYDIETGAYLNALLAGDSIDGGIVRMKDAVASSHILRLTLTYVATSMR